MNIHPAFVHFPIALLTLYALIELLPVRKFMPSVVWDGISRFMLYIGALASVATAITGIMAEEQIGESPAVEAHEEFALTLVALTLTTAAITYFWKSEGSLRAFVLKGLALALLALVFIVGALGANIVYGSGVDPIVTFITGILGVQ